MAVQPQTSVAESQITWPKLPKDFVLPDDPVENLEHPLLANALRQSLTPELCQDALITANFALCAAIEHRLICKAPGCMFARLPLGQILNLVAATLPTPKVRFH